MSGFPAAVRRIIRERSDGWCEICGQARGDDIHHRRPRGMGGSLDEATDVPSNALMLCRPCHCMCESYRNVARVAGWLVGQTFNPAATPVLYRGERVLLDDLGNLEAA